MPLFLGEGARFLFWVAFLAGEGPAGTRVGAGLGVSGTEGSGNVSLILKIMEELVALHMPQAGSYEVTTKVMIPNT